MKSFKITQSITDRQDASLKLFFKEVSKIPMITQEEELELAKKIKNGDLSATNKLVEANLRFAISVAKQYQNRGLPLVDLIQEAIFGLLEAAKKYDADKGYRFISYAVWWIRQSIMFALSSQCRIVRMPMSQIVCLSKINKALERFEQEYGRKPSMEEIESSTDLSSDKIALALESSSRSVSLDIPFKTDDAGCLLDILPNENSSEADESLIQASISKELESVLNKLSPRESDVLRMLFGLGMPSMQIEEIANRLGVGSERIRQIQREAIEKIRINYSSILRELL